MGNKYSIYKNPETEKKLMTIYENRMAQRPVPYESRYIDTGYGKVYVIISGAEDAPPILLLHASAMASWSWLYNIEGLNKYYRTYAIDTIGDAGRSVLDDIEKYPNDGKSLSVNCIQKSWPRLVFKKRVSLVHLRVEILDTGHLISAEKPDQFKKLVHDFIRYSTN